MDFPASHLAMFDYRRVSGGHGIVFRVFDVTNPDLKSGAFERYQSPIMVSPREEPVSKETLAEIGVVGEVVASCGMDFANLHTVTQKVKSQPETRI